ncbi:hypothetical protein CLV98_11151 [Dyadobacter jejuensis]|uniref:Uncharacterized protein n=1 Tax=Dyadobacter jejuensis TaxID=1082580 RepID=A0A316B1W3_9BACT|nr:hypothetical protein CLV98_11151 [Dyadobacter jejuensis]
MFYIFKYLYSIFLKGALGVKHTILLVDSHFLPYFRKMAPYPFNWEANTM